MLFAAAGIVKAAPLERRADAYTDLDILNYALTLEHLEDTFYRQGLEKFSAEDFKSCDLDETVYDRFKAISQHETTHVAFLTSAIKAAGGSPVPQCEYKFGYTDVQGFVALAQLLERTGVSAYDGANQYIMNPAYRTAAATIVTVEARHSAFLNSITNRSPFPYAFDTPLSLNEVITLAGGLISSCPYDVGIKPYNTLTVTTTSEKKDKLKLSYPNSNDNQYAYFLWGSNTTSTQIGSNGEIEVPKEITAGDVYIIVTSDNSPPSDSNIVAGPAYYSVPANW
ncbi:hypothetical protein INT43_006756 [Umbelopsis isabellina]|uniref:Uncharacterized protein n=1 Tax=Mortierella isabellina TaxID=91625 RepID=A0A8H7Q1D9_MORIS|nr:hypothetical protein INT43_006756 [Umbelopsis isabellina]